MPRLVFIVAKDGIAKKIGEKKIDIANKTAVVNAVSPVLPPSVTPLEMLHLS